MSQATTKQAIVMNDIDPDALNHVVGGWFDGWGAAAGRSPIVRGFNGLYQSFWTNSPEYKRRMGLIERQQVYATGPRA